ncbi:Ldh family oxidoreductase [Pseudaminobacter sp. 19-2017]|uniref:Ldh family oxidoreductase n=1 Tax=Pseudaminobacter soli (ex Zhang et al. 2022) TaxID=2831468 RepID=A0A942E047_9HYPH|nr:Ldh family oxidoreductase [Pseudaminobacter soli]MBS3651269.1 Ldh family oxidoreductase [Pseudaminobacter soli]
MTASHVSVPAGLIERTAKTALVRSGALPENAGPVARAMARAELEGNRVCGLFYLPIFCEHLKCGKVDGLAEPAVTTKDAVTTVDALHGFAHPAIEAGLSHLAQAARNFGVAAMAVRNSYNCLALSHHVTPLAECGLIGLCVSNAPASVAPPGAKRAIFGTNPLAFAVPRGDGAMIVVDQSMSAVTKTEMLMRRERGEPIPLGWAQDGNGAPTTDPAEGLLGSLLPGGGQKGANIALLVEILAAVLTGSRLSTEASPLGNNEGGPPEVGQFLLAIDAGHFGSGHFAASVGRLAESFAEAGIRTPGQRVLGSGQDWSSASVEIDQGLWQRCLDLAG